MKNTGKHYFEFKSGGTFGPGNAVIKITLVGKGRYARSVVSGGGKIVSTPLIRAKHGPLKEPVRPDAIEWNPSGPANFKFW